MTERRRLPNCRVSVSSSDIVFRHQCELLHALGPRPTFELLREILNGADLVERLPVYARINPEILYALGGDSMPPLPLHLVDAST
jgi:hypothetical protein